MSKTLAEIELLSDPTMTVEEASWWVRVWRESEPTAAEAGEPDAARLAFADQVAAFGAPDGDGDGELPEGVL